MAFSFFLFVRLVLLTRFSYRNRYDLYGLDPEARQDEAGIASATNECKQIIVNELSALPSAIHVGILGSSPSAHRTPNILIAPYTKCRLNA